MKKVVVAYSGGLDTSIILHWMKARYGCEVIACAVDIGQGEELASLKAKALKTGASKIVIVDARREFVTRYLWPTLQAQAVYEGKYLLGTAVARPLIAQKVVEVARRARADAVCHGATGKGNDQVRFELTFKALMPQLRIIAPWREWELRSREDEIDYATRHGIPVPVTKNKPYSSDRNLWHMSFEGGILEDPWKAPPEAMFQLTVSPPRAPNRPEVLEVTFERGVPTRINGRRFPPVALVERLNQMGGRHGVGRVDMVENRLVGMKSRGVYECPGATILYTAHRELEALTLDRETFHAKALIGPKYGELVYNGLWWSPLKAALDAFVQDTQRVVTGTVRLQLYKGHVTTLGRRSPCSLYSEAFATFGRDEVYHQRDAEGFINLFGLPLKVQALLRTGGLTRQGSAPSL